MSTEAVLVMVPGVTGAQEPGTPAFHIAPEHDPHLLVTDFGATRGDGVFETIGVYRQQPLNLDPHLRRLQRSAAMLELPEPNIEILHEAFFAALTAHEKVDEMMIRIIMTRGLEAGGHPTAWIHARQSPDFSRDRAGIRVAALDRGISSTVAEESPWLLAGAKSTSYAVNMAVGREAARRGAQDVLFVSSDGYALEGPTSTLLVRSGDSFLTTPAHAGVLPGTTVASAFEFAQSKGYSTEEALMTLEEVKAADGAWLLSSGRLAAPITAIDDTELAVDEAFTRELNGVMSFGVLG